MNKQSVKDNYLLLSNEILFHYESFSNVLMHLNVDNLRVRVRVSVVLFCTYIQVSSQHINICMEHMNPHLLVNKLLIVIIL